jgi:hypothetical protein
MNGRFRVPIGGAGNGSPGENKSPICKPFVYPDATFRRHIGRRRHFQVDPFRFPWLTHEYLP